MIIGNNSPIVIVYDDELDIRLFKRHMKKSHVLNDIIAFKLASEFLEFLELVEQNIHPYPSFVLLDINMPELNGFEVLTSFRARPMFASLPVFFMFTNSDDPKGRDKAVESGANGLFTKEFAYEQRQKFIEKVCDSLT